jgi:hypothetical protein
VQIRLWKFPTVSRHTDPVHMSSDEPLYTLLEYILNRASAAELEVIAEAVKRRQSPGKGLGGISPRSMAENVAEKVKQQLGGMLDVQTISRQIVTDLIRQKEPNISDEELEVLLDNWLPGTARSRRDANQPADQVQEQAGGQAPERVAPDVLITMISQYVSARRGTLPREEQDKLPKNWQSRFWETFPDRVRGRIREHLNGRLTEVEFWDSVISSLDQ